MSGSVRWFEQLPDLHRAEEEVLSAGISDFKLVEILPAEKTNGKLQYRGELTLTDGTKQIVAIVFPFSYPYSPPEIYPLNGILNESGLQIQPVMGPGGPVIVKHFNRGNQYMDGKVCLFRDEDVWIPFTHSVALAIKQAIAWFETALSKEGFTKELIVEENVPYTGFVGQVICYLPESLPTAPGGSIRVKSFKDNYYSLLEVAFQNVDRTEVIISFPDGTALSPVRNDIINGRWFTINGDAKNLVAAVATNPENLKAILVQQCHIAIDDLLPEPQAQAKRTVIGFRFQTNSELHFFQVFYWKEGIATKFQSSYLLTKNLSNELFARIDSLFSVDVLNSKKILAIGAGAVGSEALKELAASGILEFTIIDDDRFDAGNSVRHAADLLSIGEAKVEVVRKLIQTKNPKANVTTINSSLFSIPLDELSKLISESDLVLDFTGNRLVENYLHQKVCVEAEKPLLQAAVSKGGLTGIVVLIKPKESACLPCLQELKLNYVPVSNVNAELLKNAPADYGACSQPALPASGMDTREVAIQAARVGIQTLLENGATFYPKRLGFQFYWHGPAGTNGHRPFEWEITNVKGLDYCRSCNPNT
ncbi:MAG TPA: ThiF family adenylyltransferase [Ohtaekwangia sp.]|nr:ThiF family adenylyltransferase [Ohtaekwangia sp.]